MMLSRKLFLLLSTHHIDYHSGTEKQHVANDYAKRLHIGQVECEVGVSFAVSHDPYVI